MIKIGNTREHHYQLTELNSVIDTCYNMDKLQKHCAK